MRNTAAWEDISSEILVEWCTIWKIETKWKSKLAGLNQNIFLTSLLLFALILAVHKKMPQN